MHRGRRRRFTVGLAGGGLGGLIGLAVDLARTGDLEELMELVYASAAQDDGDDEGGTYTLNLGPLIDDNRKLDGEVVCHT